MAGEHIIQKQILQVDLPNREDAVAAQKRLEETYFNHLMPLIDQIFTDISGSDALVLDRLEIDLGRLPEHHFIEEFTKKLKEQLTNRLISEKQTQSGKVSANGRPGNTAYNEHSLEQTTNGERPTDRSQMKAFIFFLEKGRLPWWTKATSPAEILEGLTELEDSEFVQLIKEIFASSIRKKRFLQQISDHLLKEVLETTSISKKRVRNIHLILEDLIGLHQKKALANIRAEELRRIYWEAVFEFWIIKPAQSSGDSGSIIHAATEKHKASSARSGDALSLAFFRYFLLKLTSEASVSKNRIEKRVARQSVVEALIADLKNRTSVKELSRRPLAKMVRNLAEKSHQLTDMNRLYQQMADSSETSTDRSSQKRSLNLSAVEDESIEIQHAGMVLLAPFLPLLFDELALLKDKQFRDDDAAIRAASLLEYAATGETELPEHDMVLNKCLCGLPLETPIPGFIDVSAKEEEEVEHMLSSVLDHWKALKSTSIYGLRSTFINRAGLLRKDDTGWSVYIERTTVDILLDHLPWSISIIKLPWNDEPIYVEW